MTEKDKVGVDDIVGMVKTEPTNSVEEVRRLRGRQYEDENKFKLKWQSSFDMYPACNMCTHVSNLNENNRKQSEIIEWLIEALRDDDKIFKEKSISYVINNTLSDLIDGKLTVTELLEEWDND